MQGLFLRHASAFLSSNRKVQFWFHTAMKQTNKKLLLKELNKILCHIKCMLCECCQILSEFFPITFSMTKSGPSAWVHLKPYRYMLPAKYCDSASGIKEKDITYDFFFQKRRITPDHWCKVLTMNIMVPKDYLITVLDHQAACTSYLVTRNV